MDKADEYVLPLDHGLVAAQMRRNAILIVLVITVLMIALGLSTAVGFAARSFGPALPIYLMSGLVLGVALWKAPENRRKMRAISEYPPVFGSGGLRLRVVSTSGYDFHVPWPQVSRMVAKVRGRHWDLLVHIENAEGLADGDLGKLAVLRKLQGPPGAPVIYPIGYVVADLNEMDEVVRRYSGGRLSVERGG